MKKNHQYYIVFFIHLLLSLFFTDCQDGKFNKKTDKSGLFSAFYNYKNNNIYIGNENGELFRLDSNLNILEHKKVSNGIIGLTLSSPDGNYMCNTTEEGYVMFWDANKKLDSFLFKIKANNGITFTAMFSPNQKYYFSTGSDSCVRVFLWQNHQVKKLIKSNSIIRFAWMNNHEDKIFWINNSGFIFCQNLDSLRVEHKLQLSEKPLNCIVINEYLHEVAVTGDDGFLYILNYPHLTFKQKVKAHEGSCYVGEWSPDSKYIATTGIDGKINIWKKDKEIYLKTKSLSAHKGAICSLHFSKDSKKMLSAGLDGHVKEWNTDKFILIKNKKIHNYE